jgi:hypothetical protein
MNDWIRNRVKDSCNILNIMKNYLKVKENITTDLTTEFTSAVLDNIFQPCSQIYGAAHNIKAKVPDYFTQMVLNECNEFKPGRDSQSIEVIWKRLAVIIYYLIKHLNDSGSTIENIRAEIGRVQIFSSTSIHECQKIISGEYDNCVVSAIINIIRGIIDFNKKFSKNYEVTELDVKTAVSIILKTDPYAVPVKKDKLSKIVDLEEEDDTEPPSSPERKYKPPNRLYKLYKKDIETPIDEGREVLEDEDDDDLEKEGQVIFEDEDQRYIDEEVHSEQEEEVVSDQELEDLYSEEDEYSPRSDLIVVVLKTIDGIKNPEDIAYNIEEAVKIIKGWKKMSTHAKRIRINFFATQR